MTVSQSWFYINLATEVREGLRSTRPNLSYPHIREIASRLLGAYLGDIQLSWRELGHAILRASPYSDLLSNLHERFKALGTSEDRQSAWAELSEQRFREATTDKAAPAELRLRLYVERMLWGLPTRYGTDTLRAIWVTAALWVGLTFTSWLLIFRWSAPARRPYLTRLGLADERHRIDRACENGARVAAPGTRAKCATFVAYSFCLMFPVRSRLRLVGSFSPWLAGYLTGVRLIGGVALVALVLTLRSVSPFFDGALSGLGL